MSFTYTIGTDVARVRLWVGDTVSSGAIFTDEEINDMLTQSSGDVQQAAARLLIALASNRARLAKMKSAGKYSEDNRNIPKELREQAAAILKSSEEPWDATAEQTFGPVDKPWEGDGEKEFINRQNLRGQI